LRLTALPSRRDHLALLAFVVATSSALFSCSSPEHESSPDSADASVDPLDDHDDRDVRNDASAACDPECPAASVKIGDDCSGYPDGKVCVRDDAGNCPVKGTPTPMICRSVDGGRLWQFPLAT
jgi:hypothetical protein